MASQRIINGTSVSPGLALGPVHVCRATDDLVPTYTIPGGHVAREITRLHEAVDASSEELGRRRGIVAKQVGEQDAQILAAHQMILQDPEAVGGIEVQITKERINAEAAVQSVIDRIEARFADVDLSASRSIATEMSDPWRAVLELLMRRDRESVLSAGGKVVIAAQELTPNVVTFLDRDRILGVVAEKGGRFSHGAVLARSYGIPTVVGLPNLLSRLEQDMVLSVDGDRGTVQLKPGQEDVDAFLERSQKRAARARSLDMHAADSATTPDGHTIEVQVNIESLKDLETFDATHTDGVGLLRTEFLYMERATFPSEDEQYRLYRRVVEHMAGRTVTIRLLDIGGDKTLSYFKTPAEPNPALGWRGIRISLEWPDLLLVQLRAVLRASAHGPVQLLLPMVTSLEEVQRIHAMFTTVRDQLIAHGFEVADDLPVGAMIEVPSALLVLPSLMDELDFVSVGTNDLVQYLLCADRDNSRVASLYDPHHPAVIWALERVAKVAAAAGKPASLCGEFAGDRIAAIVLLGMGYQALSVAPNFVSEVKYAIRRTDLEEARKIALKVLEQTTCEDVRAAFAEARERLDQRQGQASSSARDASRPDS